MKTSLSKISSSLLLLWSLGTIIGSCDAEQDDIQVDNSTLIDVPEMALNWVLGRSSDHQSTMVHYDSASGTLFSFIEQPAAATKVDPATGDVLETVPFDSDLVDPDIFKVTQYVKGSDFFILIVENRMRQFNGVLMRMNFDLQVEWSIPMDFETNPNLDNRPSTNSPPVLSRDESTVYYNGHWANLLAYNTADGLLKWVNQLDVSLSPVTVFGSNTLFAGKRIYQYGPGAGAQNQVMTLYEFDGSTGDVRNEFSLECGPNETCPGNIAHAPVISPDQSWLYVIDGIGGLMRFNTLNISDGPFYSETGLGTVPMEYSPAISADGLTLFIQLSANFPSAIDTATATEKWRAGSTDPRLRGKILDNIVVRGDEVWYFMDNNANAAVAFGVEDGTPIKKAVDLSSFRPFRHDSFSEDALFVNDLVGFTNTLYSFALELLTSETPTMAPSSSPTMKEITEAPTTSPTPAPTAAPTGGPTGAPTAGPTGAPTAGPTGAPSGAATDGPTAGPTEAPSGAPTAGPTGAPSSAAYASIWAPVVMGIAAFCGLM